MNLRFVEAFHWTVVLKSITRAAERLHVTQSALSSRIAALEEEVGVLLLDRRDKQFRLTVAGLRFHVFAQRLLDVQRQIKSEMGVTEGRVSMLRIGAIESVVHSWLTQWLQRVRKTHPDFELELTVETTPVLIDQLHRGTLDLIFSALPATDVYVRTRALPPMEMAFVGHAVLHARKRYKLQDFSAHDLMTFQRGSQPHVALLELFKRAGIAAPRVHSISSISAMVQLVEGGFGVATLPQQAAAQLALRLPLRILKSEVSLAPLPIHASYREDPSSGLTQSIVDSALAYLRAA
jgi:DNA-binding transcriptional LysR family regulator